MFIETIINSRIGKERGTKILQSEILKINSTG